VVRVIRSRPIVAGAAEGELLATSEPLSFWGGYDHTTGEIIDRRHPLAGKRAAGRILAVPSSKGSSTTTAVLLEAIKGGTAPAAILTVGGDSFFALASIVADELFHKAIPILALERADFSALATGQYVIIGDGGDITIQT
jgi:cis-L-3-hydroxyproline dehydratase